MRRAYNCCSVHVLPIKHGLQEQGEGCDGRLVQAFLSDAIRSVRVFAWREKKVSPDTCAAGVANQESRLSTTGDAFFACAVVGAPWLLPRDP